MSMLVTATSSYADPLDIVLLANRPDLARRLVIAHLRLDQDRAGSQADA